MKITADKQQLVDVIGKAARAAGGPSSLPALSGALLTARDGKLEVVASNLEVTVWLRIDVQVAEEGRALVPASALDSYLRKLPAGNITLDATGSEFRVSGGGASLALHPLNQADYPVITPVNPEETVPVDEGFIDAVGAVAVAVSTDTTRPVFTAIKIESADSGSRLVATDSYRLAVKNVADVPVGEALVPGARLQTIFRAIGTSNVRLGVRDKELMVVTDSGEATMRLVEDKFPNWEPIVKIDGKVTATVDVCTLRGALDRASVVATEGIPVKIEFSADGLKLSYSRESFGHGAEQIAAQVTGDGNLPMTVAFNAKYLNDGLATIATERARIIVASPTQAVLVQPEGDDGHIYVVMPVRTTS